MKKKSLLGLLVACTLAVVGVFSPAFADSNGSWIPQSPNQNDPSFHGVTFQDSSPLKLPFSVLQGASDKGMVLCKSTKDPACANSEFDYLSMLKECASATDTDCVAGVEAFDASNNPTPGTFEKYTVTNHINSYTGDPKLGIPDGSMPSIWSIPTAPHASGSDYAVVAGMSGWVNSDGSSDNRGSILAVSLVPVVLHDFGQGQNSQLGFFGSNLKDVYYDGCGDIQQTPTRMNIGCGHVNGPQCLLPTNTNGQCYMQEDFPANVRFGVQLRLSKEPNGWLHGRMVDPNVTITKDPNGGIDLSVLAGSTSIPMVYQGADWSSLPAAVQNFWVECMVGGDSCGPVGGGQGDDPNYWEESTSLAGNAKTNLNASPYAFGQIALDGVSAISPLVGNKSNALTASWSFRTLSNDEMNGADKCFSSTPGIKGIVTTNSTAYSAGPPAFTGGALNYKVASPHFNPDGTTPFKGNYNLVIRSDVARCIYGFSSAPISASISIISSDGSDDVATTVAGEKDGWLSLSANGFEFSSPVIQVKLTQNGSSAPAAGQKASAPSVPAVVKTPLKVTTITYVKSATTKKVSGINPACPSGYKKK